MGKLYQAKPKPYISNTQKHGRLLWARAHLRWTDAKGKSVLWSDESTFQIAFGNHGRVLKRKRTIQVAYNLKATIHCALGASVHVTHCNRLHHRIFYTHLTNDTILDLRHVRLCDQLHVVHLMLCKCPTNFLISLLSKTLLKCTL